jgi:hypothetical protein
MRVNGKMYKTHLKADIFTMSRKQKLCDKTYQSCKNMHSHVTTAMTFRALTHMNTCCRITVYTTIHWVATHVPQNQQVLIRYQDNYISQ